ncbi:hypothetical protein TNCV_405621 [Trichonephila clavipes]|nr:hypothetical protein TNCV_405621 [Trichonephila clavipes]
MPLKVRRVERAKSVEAQNPHDGVAYKSGEGCATTVVAHVDVQSDHSAYRGRIEYAVECMREHVSAAWCPPKYKQHADRQ